MSDFFEQLDSELGSIPKNPGSEAPQKTVPKAPISSTPQTVPQKLASKPTPEHPPLNVQKPFFATKITPPVTSSSPIKKE